MKRRREQRASWKPSSLRVSLLALLVLLLALIKVAAADTTAVDDTQDHGEGKLEHGQSVRPDEQRIPQQHDTGVDHASEPGVVGKDRAREADRLYASAIKILSSLRQRNDPTSAASLNGNAATSPSLFSSNEYFSSSTSTLLQPASYTPLLDYAENLLDRRTKYLGKLVRLYRRIANKHAQRNETLAVPVKPSEAGGMLSSFKKSSKGASIEYKKKAAVELAVERLDKAYSLGKAEAALALADLYLWGRYTLSSNATQAASYYLSVAELTGDPYAQYMLGFLHSTNYGLSMSSPADVGGHQEGEGDQGAAVLQYTFSALGGQTEAELSMGYRYWSGIGVPQNCQDALPWYKAAADKAIAAFNDPLTSPPGGRHLPPPKVRLADVSGGVYGPGSSSISSNPNSHHHSSHAGHHHPVTESEWNDVLEFYQFHADRGDSTFMFRIGRLYYTGFNPLNSRGGGTLEHGGRDFQRALRWFMRIARSVWPRDPLAAYVNPANSAGAGNSGPNRQVSQTAFYDLNKDFKLKVEDHLSLAAGLAAGYIGRMYLRGEGLEQDFQKAYLWFQRGISQGDRESLNGLGIMHRDGLGLAKEPMKALSFFLSAAQSDHVEALVNVGRHHYERNELAQAAQHFEAAIRHGDTFQAYYYLAEINGNKAEGSRSCPVATAFYKLVAERGDWETSAPWWEAERAWARGDVVRALLGYWIMAERGYEVAQNNVAWILDRDKKFLALPDHYDYRLKSSNVTDRLALMFWTRSAAQDNVDALVKMGDYYLKGLGLGRHSNGVPQPEKAAACYGSAASTQVSSLAMHNLGWMHENGVGVSQDFHLAKRYYDLSLETNSEAYLPVTLSLVKLHARSLYKALKAGDIKSISLFLSNEYDLADGASGEDGAEGGEGRTAWLWSWKKLRDEFFKRWIGEEMARQQAQRQIQQQEAAAGQTPLQSGNEQPGQLGTAGAEPLSEAGDGRAALESQDDPVAWARKRRDDMIARAQARQQQEEFDDLDLPDFFSDTIGGRGRDEADDLLETVAIVGLCLVLGWLVYIRQARYDGARARRQPQPPNREEVEGNAVNNAQGA